MLAGRALEREEGVKLPGSFAQSVWSSPPATALIAHPLLTVGVHKATHNSLSVVGGYGACTDHSAQRSIQRAIHASTYVPWAQVRSPYIRYRVNKYNIYMYCIQGTR